MKFSKDFIFGVACSSYQTEGAWNEDGKGSSVWDEFCHTSNVVVNGETGDVACDSYHRAKQDVKLLKELGVDAYRFSVSWPRIFPDGEQLNEAGFKFYDELIDLLSENGITPYLTLYHWDTPLALEKNGGWQNRRTAEAFAVYAAAVAKHFDKRVYNYITLNEPQCVVWLGYNQCINAPGRKLEQKEQCVCMHNLLLAHGLSAKAIRDNSTDAVSVGIASTGRLCYPNVPNAQNTEAARKSTFRVTDADWSFTHTWVLDPIFLGHYPQTDSELLNGFAKSIDPKDFEIITAPLDFLGLNIYNGHANDEHGNDLKRGPGFPRTALKWPVCPEVLRFGPQFIAQRYNIPLIITENGQACNDRVFLDGKVHDPERIDFLTRYLAELGKCIADGIDIRGYFHWSFTDNFEWNNGYNERFGMVFTDYETLERIPKDSFYWYQELIKSCKQ